MINLFNRNFDDSSVLGGGLAGFGPDDVRLEDLLAQTRQDGYNEGAADATAQVTAQHAESDAAHMAEDHGAIVDLLTQIMAAEEARAQASQTALTELFLGLAERLVPELLSSYGEQLALDRIKDALIRVQTDSEIVIRLRSGLADALNARLESWRADYAHIGAHRVRVVADDNETTARIEWQEGRFDYCLETACAEVLAALREAAPTQDTTSKESH